MFYDQRLHVMYLDELFATTSVNHVFAGPLLSA